MDAKVWPAEVERWPLDRLRVYYCNARTHSPEQIGGTPQRDTAAFGSAAVSASRC